MPLSRQEKGRQTDSHESSQLSVEAQRFSLKSLYYHCHSHPSLCGSQHCIFSCREVPAELRRLAHGGQVNLDMEDHRDEDFVKPKGAFRAFTGEGQKLGR